MKDENKDQSYSSDIISPVYGAHLSSILSNNKIIALSPFFKHPRVFPFAPFVHIGFCPLQEPSPSERGSISFS